MSAKLGKEAFTAVLHEMAFHKIRVQKDGVYLYASFATGHFLRPLVSARLAQSGVSYVLRIGANGAVFSVEGADYVSAVLSLKAAIREWKTGAMPGAEPDAAPAPPGQWQRLLSDDAVLS
jgi:hypothetical protein